MLGHLSHIKARRADLLRHIDVQNAFEEWEETCVPSYCHSNLLAAYISWLRLFRVVYLAQKNHPGARTALDFGSSVGELGHLLPNPAVAYHFVEQEERAAAYLLSRLPKATQQTLDTAVDGAYDWIFAIDSLEHNDDYAKLIGRLAAKLSPQGILILSGPTENHLYRLGRAVAGYHTHHHVTTIYEIEKAAARHLTKRDSATIMPGAALFRLSVWARSPSA